jgi:hypothetical protein
MLGAFFVLSIHFVLDLLLAPGSIINFIRTWIRINNPISPELKTVSYTVELLLLSVGLSNLQNQSIFKHGEIGSTLD